MTLWRVAFVVVLVTLSVVAGFMVLRAGRRNKEAAKWIEALMDEKRKP